MPPAPELTITTDADWVSCVSLSWLLSSDEELEMPRKVENHTSWKLLFSDKKLEMPRKVENHSQKVQC